MYDECVDVNNSLRLPLVDWTGLNLLIHIIANADANGVHMQGLTDHNLGYLISCCAFLFDVASSSSSYMCVYIYIHMCLHNALRWSFTLFTFEMKSSRAPQDQRLLKESRSLWRSALSPTNISNHTFSNIGLIIFLICLIKTRQKGLCI